MRRSGSKLGLVVQSRDAREFGIVVEDSHEGERIRDVGGGTVRVRRRTAGRVMLGGMSLRNVPTDVMSGAAQGTPILLGRDLLRPFVIAFDPRARLIRFSVH